MNDETAPKLAPLFTDHAVLQRGQPIPIWGRAQPGENITVTFHGRTSSATAAADGRWLAYLKPEAATDRGAELSVVAKRAALVLRDVIVGDVWLCSGQSNMEFEVYEAFNAQREIIDGAIPTIRQLKIAKIPAAGESEEVHTDGWKPASPEAVSSFTAVGFFFAREIRRRLGIPIGLINSTWGGTPIESWLPEKVLRGTSAYPDFAARWAKSLETFPERLAAYPALETEWLAGLEHARATGTKNPVPWPHPPIGPGTAYSPGALFNGMIAPLCGCALRGILWYQGESNAERPHQYAELFAALIRAWRVAWGKGELPFLYVQIANFQPEDPAENSWAFLREAQSQALALPQTGQAIAIDIGEADEIHPRNKQEVGRRLALLAERRVYALPVEDCGPALVGALRENGAYRIYFSHAGGLRSRAGAPLTGFEVAGPDRNFYPAVATIDALTVVVSSVRVASPVAVRYAWQNNPPASLYNGAGLPAAPFRTDSW